MNSGIRQGCPFSPMAFVVALELLAIQIRNDSNINGINLPKGKESFNEQMLKILLYADDITMFLNNRNDLKNALTLISYFSKCSGLSVNRKKTEAMWLGSNKSCKEEYEGLTWKSRVNILGIYFSNTMPASEIEENWLPRLILLHNGQKEILASWVKYAL
eukprot:TRINITY_DN119526_c0_g1_i10.p1 TRINITY_DN119526_c0_g1~~TRINITY_DN119526_c0_g1_i10.p1  ORF type:complete len:187 (+),score=15.52 TRINITY_DN119526_c0_g1_i10:82-561(+)